MEESRGGRPEVDFVLTLDMAKELAMVERNEKGRQIRQYFIWAETKLRALAQPRPLPCPMTCPARCGSWPTARKKKPSFSMNELIPISLANGSVTHPDEVFSVSLDDVWHISYSSKASAVKSLRKNFVQGVHYRILRSNPENPQGGRPKTTILLTKECAKKLLANKLRMPELRKAQRKTYFILCKEANAVKIGIALDASERISILQCGNPFTLRLLLVIPLNVEAKLHRKFSALRLQNEWFSFDKAIADFIDECKTGALLSEII